MSSRGEQVADNIWLLRYPLRRFGIDFYRNVTVIRLSSGKLLIHSTAPFTAEDVRFVNSLGEPAWLLDATLFHDTFARKGRNAFPTIPYFTPDNPKKALEMNANSLDSPPLEWAAEVSLLELLGMPFSREYLFLHRPSRTLVVSDFIFHLQSTSWWPRFFVRSVMRLPDGLGMSFFFRAMIRDREAFAKSIRQIMTWDFDQIIVGHGEMVRTGGKQSLKMVLKRGGFESATERKRGLKLKQAR